ncbi:MAG: hypothetical protein Q7U60_11855 [Candidatus Methanoperedens sp.]|nr:hypothetical protein [Candidatus Methanoperedens sp.]
MKTDTNINSELNTNSYELRVKYFQLFGAPIETDAGYAYRKYKPQIPSRASEGRRHVCPQAYVDSRSRRVIGTQMNADL